MELKEQLQAQLSEAESLKTELEALKHLPELLYLHDQVAHRLFHLTRRVEVPEGIIKKELFEPNRVEPATVLVESIANQLRLKLQLQELKEKKGGDS